MTALNFSRDSHAPYTSAAASIPSSVRTFFGFSLMKYLERLISRICALRSFGLLQFSKQNDSRCAGVVKQIFGQKDHGFDQVVLYKRFANIPLSTGLLTTGPTGHRAGVKDNRGATVLLSGRRVYAAYPRPISGGTRCNAIGETSIAVVGVEGLVIFFLVPHRIGKHVVKASQL